MDEQTDGQPLEPKRAKLDELFADEPWLSPTMKARRLHEKLNGLYSTNGNGAAQDNESTNALPTQAWVQAKPSRPEADAEPTCTVAETAALGPTSAVQPVSLAEAASFLRATRGIGEEPNIDPWSASRLLALRDGPLTAWLRELR